MNIVLHINWYMNNFVIRGNTEIVVNKIGTEIHFGKVNVIVFEKTTENKLGFLYIHIANKY